MFLSQQPFQGSAQFGPSLTNSFDGRRSFDSDIKNLEGPSRLRSPIPPDPGYGDDPFAQRCRTVPIVRLKGSEARTIYKRAIANTGAPFRLDTNSKANKSSKNYSNENLKRMRRIMKETQKRQSEKEKSQQQPVKALWHLKQFDNVESKVKQKLKEDSQRSASRPGSAQGNYLRAHGRTGPQILRSQSTSDLRRTSVGSSVDLKNTQPNDKAKPDYVKMNSQYVKDMTKLRRSSTAEAAEKAHEKTEKSLNTYLTSQKGHVPDYIEKLKEKREQERQKAIKNAPDPECPRGHITMDDDERKKTLAKLEENRTALERNLGHLPVHNDSVKLRKTKQDIEKRLIELDEAVKIFSKPKVFVKIAE